MPCFTLNFEGNFPSTSLRGAYIWRGDLTEGFLRYLIGGLIFGEAYTCRGLFSEFYGISWLINITEKTDLEIHLSISYSTDCNIISIHAHIVFRKAKSNPTDCCDIESKVKTVGTAVVWPINLEIAVVKYSIILVYLWSRRWTYTIKKTKQFISKYLEAFSG